MILDLSSIHEEDNEDDTAPQVKLPNAQPPEEKLIPAKYKNEPPKPYVPEIYTKGAKKHGSSSSGDSYSNFSISKLAANNYGDLLNDPDALNMLCENEIPENAAKNPTSFDLVGLDDLQQRNRLSNEKIDSFLEISNKIFKNEVPLANNFQISELINMSENDKVYLPPRRIKFKGININHTIALVGSAESVINLYGSGFRFTRSPDKKALDLQQVNIKVHDSITLFEVQGHSCAISMQNSVAQCSYKHLTSLRQGSTFLSIGSGGRKHIDKIVVNIENSMLNDFETLLGIEEGLTIGTLRIRIHESHIAKFSRLLDLRNCRVAALQVELSKSVLETMGNLFAVDSLCAEETLVTSTMTTFTDCKEIIRITGPRQLRGLVSFRGGYFINSGPLFYFSRQSMPINFERCGFVSCANKALLAVECSKLKIVGCHFSNSSAPGLMELNESSMILQYNLITNSKGPLLILKGKQKRSAKEVAIRNNKFISNSSNLLQLDIHTKGYRVRIEYNVFEANELPLHFKRLSRSTKVLVNLNQFRLKTKRHAKVKAPRSVSVESNYYEYGIGSFEYTQVGKPTAIDRSFYSGGSGQEIKQLFDDNQG